MNKRDIAEARNPALRASLVALQRAAKVARQVAVETDTAIVLVQNGELVRISAEQLRKEKQS